MENTIVVILFCILAVLVIATWVAIDKLYSIDHNINGLSTLLEMINRESENMHASIKRLTDFTIGITRENKAFNISLEGIYDINNRNDKECSRAVQRDVDNKRDEAAREKIDELKNMDLKYDLPEERLSEMPSFNIDPMIKHHIKKETKDFKVLKTIVDFLQNRLPQTKDNFSFKAMQSLGDAGKFMLVRVPHKGEGLPIKIELFIQNGPINQYGENGMQVTDVLQWVHNMYELLNEKFPCQENISTLINLRSALGWQMKRTERREKQGTEGYDKETESNPTTNNNDFKGYRDYLSLQYVNFTPEEKSKMMEKIATEKAKLLDEDLNELEELPSLNPNVRAKAFK